MLLCLDVGPTRGTRMSLSACASWRSCVLDPACPPELYYRFGERTVYSMAASKERLLTAGAAVLNRPAPVGAME